MVKSAVARFLNGVASSVNSVTTKSLAVDEKIHEITGLSGFKGSYTYLRGFLDRGAHGLISGHKKWCGQCYSESLLENVGVKYARVADHLYWSLDLSSHCIKHLCTLSYRCGKCLEKQPYISSVVEPGFCHFCFASLADAPSEMAIDKEERLKIKALILKYDIFYPGISKPSDNWTMSSLAKKLRSVIELSGDGGLEHISLRCGISPHTLKDWCDCRHGISLPSLLNLLDGFDLERSSDLFIPSEEFSDLVEHQFNNHFNFRSRQSRRSLLPGISQYLKRMLDGKEEAESRALIAKRFGVSKGMLENAFKHELEQLSKLYAEQLEAASLKIKDSLQYEMNRAVRRCGAKNRRCDWPHILAELQGIDLKCVSQQALDQARTKAIKSYIESDNRDQARAVDTLVCDL